MYWRMIGVVLAFGFVLGTGSLAGAPGSEPKKKPSKLEKELEAACKEVCKEYLEQIKIKGGRRIADEEYFTWSIRWLEAQKALSLRKADLVAAYKAHWERTKEREETAKKMYDHGSMTSFLYNKTKYYRIQAEIWLNEAEGKK
jgi:hypothetical protein